MLITCYQEFSAGIFHTDSRKANVIWNSWLRLGEIENQRMS